MINAEMWQPVSGLDYVPLNPEAQAVVVYCPLLHKRDEIIERWKDRAVAAIHDSSKVVEHVVRDLLANPNVRIVVFHGPACGRDHYDKFWRGTDDPGWGISPDHLALVRQFVDMCDDDFMIKSPMQPFWPARILYEKEATK